MSQEPESHHPGDKYILQMAKDTEEAVDALRQNPKRAVQIGAGLLGVNIIGWGVDKFVIQPWNHDVASLVGMGIATLDLSVGVLLFMAGGGFRPSFLRRRKSRD